MNDLIKKLLPDPLPRSERELITLVRELLQSIALLGLWRGKFFEQAAFYGGTALRILYGLDRFSEDLDFSLLAPSKSFHFDTYARALQKEINAFGFKLEFDVRQKKETSPIESAFLKGNTFEQLLTINAFDNILSSINKRSVLKIKLEIDIQPPKDFNTEIKYVFSPVQFAVRTYNLPSLFAGKIHALLYRRWGSRVKGRDWYDFAWYISHHPHLNLKHLEERMRQSGDYSDRRPLTKQVLTELLMNTIDDLDMDAAKKEVLPFIRNAGSLDIWSEEFFKSAVNQIEII